MLVRDETIAQIATAAGPGGVGIVRVSGKAALAIGRALVGRREAPEERRAELVSARDADGAVIDSGLYLEFVAPRSFTGEDVCEFHGHGGTVGLGRILRRRWKNPTQSSKAMFCSEMAVSVLQLSGVPWSRDLVASEVSPQDLMELFERQAALGDEVQAHDAGQS